MPVPWYALPRWQRWFCSRTSGWGERCVIDGKWFFIRGRIASPIIGTDETCYWGVWVGVSREGYRDITKYWKDVARAEHGPYFGWLMTSLPYDLPTLELKTMVRIQPREERPRIDVEPTDHPLALEQQNGIPMTRQEFASD